MHSVVELVTLQQPRSKEKERIRREQPGQDMVLKITLAYTLNWYSPHLLNFPHTHKYLPTLNLPNGWDITEELSGPNHLLNSPSLNTWVSGRHFGELCGEGWCFCFVHFYHLYTIAFLTIHCLIYTAYDYYFFVDSHEFKV